MFFFWNCCSYEFLRTTATELNDGGRDLMMKQRGFQLINPTEKWFPGLNEIREKYASWDWRISKTPKFTVQKQLQLKSDEQEHGVQLKVNVVEVRAHMPTFSYIINSTFITQLNAHQICIIPNDWFYTIGNIIIFFPFRLLRASSTRYSLCCPAPMKFMWCLRWRANNTMKTICTI